MSICVHSLYWPELLCESDRISFSVWSLQHFCPYNNLRSVWEKGREGGWHTLHRIDTHLPRPTERYIVYFHILPHICNMQSVNLENHLQLFQTNDFPISRRWLVCVSVCAWLIVVWFSGLLWACYTTVGYCNLPLAIFIHSIHIFTHCAIRVRGLWFVCCRCYLALARYYIQGMRNWKWRNILKHS